MKNFVMILTNKPNNFKIRGCAVLPLKINKFLFRSSFNDSFKKEKEKKLPKKKKIVVTKKTYSADPNKPSKILQWAEASQILKRFNWENKHLFGPTLSPRNEKYYKSKFNEFKEIVQHKSRFPIQDPDDVSDLKLYPIAHTDANNNRDKNQEFDLKNVLDFPLLNKSFNERTTQSKTIKINALRKHLENKSNFVMPSVSAILNKTMPKDSVQALAHWKQNMIEKLGEEGFQKYRIELLQNGTSLHSNINSYLSATPEGDIHVEDGNLGHWKSLKSVFPRITDIKLLEERVSHPFLCYKGVVDCFAKYRDQLVVIDWKTSKRTKGSLSSTYDNPLQIAAYAGALNFDPKFQYLASKGLIVVAYESGTPANTLFIDKERMKMYWKEWLKRLKLYWEIVNSST